MKTFLRILAFLLGVVFALISLLIPASSAPVKKNELLLADMKDYVRAIKEFEHDARRLPTEDELAKIQDSVPRRYSYRYQLRFGYPPFPPDEKHPEFPKTGGWIVWYWRGEWPDYYSSWNDYYSLQDHVSFWRFVGPLVWAPPLSLLFFAFGFLRVLRKEPNQSLEPTLPSVTPPAAQESRRP